MNDPEVVNRLRERTDPRGSLPGLVTVIRCIILPGSSCPSGSIRTSIAPVPGLVEVGGGGAAAIGSSPTPDVDVMLANPGTDTTIASADAVPRAIDAPPSLG